MHPICPLEYVGIDEVGRGALAGVMVIAIAALREQISPQSPIKELAQLNDSKKLSPKKREQIASWLREIFELHLCVFSPAYIDNIGISAAYAAAKDTACALYENKAIVIDGNLGDERVKGEIKADSKYPAVMAASIAAKVWRDRQMCAIDDAGYGFCAHKGYGTSAHFAALERLGASEHHRRSFLRGWLRSGSAAGSLQMQYLKL